MSLHSEYVREREGYQTIEYPDVGFATFRFNDEMKECYIRDIYVRPEFRRDRVANKMADQISSLAKERGCKILTGSIVPSMKGSTESLHGLLWYGFKLHACTNDYIVLVKEL